MTIDKMTNNEATIRNTWAIFSRGIFLILLGMLLFIINSEHPVGILLPALSAIAAGIMGFLFAVNNTNEQIRRGWLMIESGADILLGVIFFFLYVNGADNVEEIRKVFALFSVFFAFMQFIFIFMIAQTGLGFDVRMAVIRALTAIGYGLFGLILIAVNDTEKLSFLISCIGLGPIISGMACLNPVVINRRQ